MLNQANLKAPCRYLLICTVLLLSGGIHAEMQTAAVEQRVRRALERPKLEDQLQSLSQVGETLALEEIPAALAIAGSLGRLRERGVLIEAAYKSWARIEPAEAFVQIAKLTEGRDKASILRYAAAKYVQRDPKTAVHAIMRLPAGRSRQEAIEAAASAWAEIDARSALAWANQLPIGAPRENAIYNIRFIWVHTDPISASEHIVSNVPSGDIKNALLTNIASEWALLDPNKAVEWARSLSDNRERGLALTGIAETWADRDPEAALQFALRLSPPELSLRAIALVFERWATQDPRGAVEVAVRLPEQDQQLAGIEAILNLWSTIVPQEAVDWVTKLPPGAVKTKAIQCYVSAVSNWAPDLGLKLVESSAPDLAGSPGAEECARQWLSLDFGDASAWIGDAKLPEKTKAQWCSPVRSQFGAK